MRTDSYVTLWHFDEFREVWTREDFPAACATAKQRLAKNGIKQKGFYDASGCIVRIPGSRQINVKPGDYVNIGICKGAYPDKQKALKVIEVSDNRRGGSPHWRLSCGG